VGFLSQHHVEKRGLGVPPPGPSSSQDELLAHSHFHDKREVLAIPVSVCGTDFFALTFARVVGVRAEPYPQACAAQVFLPWTLSGIADIRASFDASFPVNVYHR
jgi:hypothetical protein